MAALWVLAFLFGAALLALWALLEGVHERLRAIERSLERIDRRLQGREPGAGA